MKYKKGMNKPSTTWMNLENIRLTERSQSQKITHYVIHSYVNEWLGG